MRNQPIHICQVGIDGQEAALSYLPSIRSPLTPAVPGPDEHSKAYHYTHPCHAIPCAWAPRRVDGRFSLKAMLDVRERCFPVRIRTLEREVMSIRTYKLKLILMKIIKTVKIVRKDNRP